ncbi:DEAD/DEAH box helicase [Anoxybacteroides rupiense]|uniref:DEAD/DEAH box helicase n=1 Tax=Anoxybacteroides rupiense TaxID=311460 RepID=UPI001606DACE|nr:DEAD/DEAH box helicase [Anoxybacillus rupiensis]MBB3909105.1 SNF2 family DNA or RNA helicase [Anoxybacillus rupiensis]
MIKTITLMGRWLDEEEAFFLYSNVPLNLWQTIAFSWHEESFYGTLLSSAKIGHEEGVLLSPWEAATFFALSPENELAPLEWSESLSTWRQWAQEMMDDICEMRLMPDFSAWKKGGFGWKRKDGADEDRFLIKWRSLAINEWIRRDRELNETWEEIVRTYPLTTSHIPYWLTNEDDWLYEIGWNGQRPPFMVALRLTEPMEDFSHWSLETVLVAHDETEALVWHKSMEWPNGWREHEQAIQRAHRLWLKIVPWLADENGGLLVDLDDEQAWRFLSEASEQLVEAGVRILLPSWWEAVKQTRLTLKAKVKSSPSSNPSLLGLDALVDFDWKIATNGVELSEEEFDQLVAQKRRLMQVHGRWIQLDPKLIQHVQSLMKKAREEGVAIRDILQEAFVQQTQSETSEETGELRRFAIELNRSFQTLVSKLTNIDRIPSVSIPHSFKETLRPYQQRGVDWLLFLRRFRLGACLADDMGLGKTVQMLAYWTYVQKHEANQQPSLLICPTSVIGNWQKECERFAPSLNIYIHHGSNRAKKEAFVAAVKRADLVLTSYSLAHLDSDELKSIEWDTICLDEAQNIKNADTKQARAIRTFIGRHKIALSGTPMENRLSELWSIFHFINPGYLGSQKQFQRRFAIPIEKERDTQKVAVLQNLIRPFLLRRTKTDEAIALDLPDKLEQKEYCPLTAEQASLYEELVQQTLADIEKADRFERRGLILQMLNHLKQLCNHPALYLKEANPANLLARSRKLEKLLELIEQIRERGESCLIFTQYIEMGRMIQQLISSHFHEQTLFLNGSVPKAERDRMIEQFQQGAFHMFILSLKAGGIGLNLTAANHVIHFDRWWNPAVENQATDRAYRIGQKRFVHVHKLITVGTLEEKIDEMIERKQALNNEIIQSEAWITELSNEELRELLILPAMVHKGAERS